MAAKTDAELIERIGAALGKVFEDALKTEKEAGEFAVELKEAKIIIFSDHHRGGRNAADDFIKCERAYHAALGYYFSLGYTLVVLGDVEELWEEHPETVLKAYPYTVTLEKRFLDAGRYLRFWGNHDETWQDKNFVRKYLEPVYKTSLNVREGLRIKVRDGGKDLGSLFLTHGHQGTKDSDKWAWLSRFLVRYGWQPFQLLTGYAPNTPAGDWHSRDRHDQAMYQWAQSQAKTVLITGHTHKPVFASRSHLARAEKSMKEASKALGADSLSAEKLAEYALRSADFEWIKAKELRDLHDHANDKPCYFNAGCCSFSDGDVTGIEISGGMIRLIRWPDNSGSPRPQTLEEEPLDSIFAQL